MSMSVGICHRSALFQQRILSCYRIRMPSNFDVCVCVYVYIHICVYTQWNEKSEIMPLVATWIYPEIIILSEVRKRNIR